MSVDETKEKFDEALGRALRMHVEPVPGGFVEKTLSRIEEDEQRRILAKVVLQERVALAGCVGLLIAAAAVVFGGIGGGLVEKLEVFTSKLSQVIEVASYEWQFYAVIGGLLGFAVYSFVDLLAGDS